MAAADPDALRKLASLARLRLDEQELAQLAPELERILAAFGVLARAAAGAETPAPLPARTRDDAVRPSLGREQVLAAAPLAEDGFFAVPKTIGSAR